MPQHRNFLILAAAALIGVLSPAQSPAQDSDSSFLDQRLQVSAHADASQPHWIAPLFTTTPRLLEQLRFDVATQPKQGFETTNFGGGKGLELIPIGNTELLISTPPYLTHDKPGVQDGLGDMSFLLKYRMASGNEEGGNYIVTAFLGASVPTGTYSNGATAAMITPTIAAGKGLGHFDFQTTFGVAVPTDHMDKIGIPCLTMSHSNTGYSVSSGPKSKSTPRSGITVRWPARNRCSSRLASSAANSTSGNGSASRSVAASRSRPRISIPSTGRI